MIRGLCKHLDYEYILGFLLPMSESALAMDPHELASAQALKILR